MEGAAVLMEDLSLLLQDENDRAPDRYDAEGLVRRVENEGSPQCGTVLPTRAGCADGTSIARPFRRFPAHQNGWGEVLDGSCGAVASTGWAVDRSLAEDGVGEFSIPFAQ